MCAVHESGPAPRPVADPPPARPGAREAVQRRIGEFLSRPWVAPVAIALCVAGATAGIVATNPTDNTGPTTCLFKLATGFDCPGCGGTRALYYLATLNLPEAARHHLPAVFAAPFLVWMFLAWAVPRLLPRRLWRLPTFHLTPRAVTVFLAAWGLFTVARNLPWPPFTFFYV